MANQPKKYKKFVATAATATLVASAIVPVASAAFTDVAATDSHKANIDALVEAGIIAGYPDGTFKPYAELTRGNVVKLLGKWAEKQGIEAPADFATEARFNDLAADSADQELVKYAALVKDAGIFNGSNGNLNAAGKITRENMALVLDRAYSAIFGTTLVELAKTQGTASVVADLATARAETQPAIQALKDLGITTPANFNPKGAVTRAQFASFLNKTIHVEANATPIEITSVEALDDASRFLQITFSQPVAGLDAADITVQDVDNLDTYGVKNVKLSSTGKVATVELFASEDETDVLARNQEYTVSVNVFGEVVESTFIRADYTKARVLWTDAKDKKFRVDAYDAPGTKRDQPALTISVPKDVEFDYADALGREAHVWFDENKDLVEIRFVDETVYTGKVEVTETVKLNAANEVIEGEVKAGDTEYTLAEDVKLYVDGDTNAESVTSLPTILKDGAEFEFVRAFLNDSGEIELIQAYNFEDFFVVSKVDGEVLVAADGEELDLEDYLIFKDGKQVKASDVQSGDVVFFNAKAQNNDGIAEVSTTTVTGTIEDVYETHVKIGGKLYKYADFKGLDVIYDSLEKKNGVVSALYLDGDDFKAVDTDVLEEFQAGGEVTLHLNHKGAVVYVSGKQEDVTKNRTGFFSSENVIAYNDNGVIDRGTIELEGLTAKGEEKLYKFRTATLNTITVNNVDYDVNDDFPGTVNAGVTDKEIDEFWYDPATKFIVAVNASNQVIGKVLDTTVLNIGAAYEIKTDDSGNVKELEVFSKKSTAAGTTYDETDKYIAGAKLLAGTVVYDKTDGTDADDVEVKTWSDIKSITISSADIYVNEDNEIEYLVVTTTKDDDTDFVNGIINNVYKNSDNEITSIRAWVNGELKTYTVDKVKGNFSKGHIVELELDEATGIVEEIKTTADKVGTVESVSLSDRTIKLVGDAKTYKIDADYEVYEYTDGSNVDTEQLREIKVGDYVALAFTPESNDFIDTIIIDPIVKRNDSVVSNPTVPAPTVTATFADTDGDANQIAGEVVVTATNAATTTVTVGGVNVPAVNGKYTIAENTAKGDIVVTVANSAGVTASTTVTYTDKVDAPVVTAKTVQALKDAGVVTFKANTLTGQLSVLIDTTKLTGDFATLAGKSLQLVVGTEKLDFTTNQFKQTQIEVMNTNFTEAQLLAATVEVK